MTNNELIDLLLKKISENNCGDREASVDVKGDGIFVGWSNHKVIGVDDDGTINADK